MIDNDDNLPHRAATDIVPAVDLRSDLIKVHERAVRAERFAAAWKRTAQKFKAGRDEDRLRIARALEYAVSYGGIDGDHHKRWVIDQMVRALTGCPMVPESAINNRGAAYTFESQGESDEYRALVAEARGGENGLETYDWGEGIPP